MKNKRLTKKHAVVLYLIVPVFVAVLNLFVFNSARADITTGLVGWWQFDDGSGASAIDSSGNGFTGSLIGGPVWTAGKINGALSFDGTNYVTVPDAPALEVGNSNADFSVSFWIYLNQGATGAWRNIVHKGLADSDRTFAMWMHPGDNGIHYRISTTVSSNEGGDSVAQIPLNSWTYISYVKAGSQLNLYINGSLDSSAALSGATISNTGPIYIGKDPWYAGTNANFDDVRIYNRQLTAADVQQLYNAGGTSGPVGWWKFDECSGTTASDSSGNGNSGTLVNGPAWSTGYLSNALNFNGVSNYVDYGNPAALQITGNITLSAWVNVTAFPANSGDISTIMARGFDTSLNQPYFLDIINNSGTLQLRIGRHSGSVGFAAAAWNITGWGTGTWHLVTGVYDGTNWIIYFDGVQMASASVSTGAIAGTLGFTVGARNYGGPIQDFFNGSIDDARVYNRALSPAEVSALAGAAPTAPGCGVGNINVSATLNGSAWTGAITYTLSGPQTLNGTVAPQTFNNAIACGTCSYTLTYVSGGPAGASWSSTTPIPSQNLSPNTTIAFTMNFTTTLTADIKANGSDGPVTIAYNTSATITWTSTGADSCSVSPGGWTGLSGSQSTGNLTSNQTYTLTCLKSGSPNATDQVIVNQTCGNGVKEGTENCDAGPYSPTVGWWKLDDGSGSAASDSSGNGNSGTLVNNPTWISGKYGGALNFSAGAGQEANFGDPASGAFEFGTNDFSVSLWARTTTGYVNQGSSRDTLIGKDSLVTEPRWAMHISSTNAPWARIAGPNSVVYLEADSAIAINDGAWHHIVMARNSGQLAIYVDNIKSVGNSGTVDLTSTAPLIVADDTSGIRHFNGDIDDIRLFNYALSDTQVAALYRANLGGATCTSLGFTGGTLGCSLTSCFYDVTQCTSPPSPQCSDGVDNDNDNKLDADDPGCHSDGKASNAASYLPNKNDERNQCSDTIDNDGDGLKDCQDPGCHTDGNPSNAASCDGTGTSESNKIFREF